MQRRGSPQTLRRKWYWQGQADVNGPEDTSKTGTDNRPGPHDLRPKPTGYTAFASGYSSGR